ncbi:MAG: MoaD/ThiS family protein [Syntrophaceae bacterium]|nr:MoaD/ThiS family protein [Syntrophaceae bacterium]
MNRVTIELWLWLGKELKGFESVTEMRSVKEESVEEGTTIRQLLDRLARSHPPIAEKVFDLTEKRVYPYVVINYNDRVISPYEVYDKVLKDGDKITILPMYVGG